MEIIYPSSFLNYIDENDINENPIDYNNFREDSLTAQNYYTDESFSRLPLPFTAMPPTMPQLPGNYNNNLGDKPPMAPPPSYTPSKNDKKVKQINNNNNYYGGSKNYGNSSLKSVSNNSIRFCLYKYTYIWQENGRSYWAFLTRVDRWSISGFRWVNYHWSYFGLDLNSIDSFQCN